MKHPHREEYNPAYPSQSLGETPLNLNMVKRNLKVTILVAPLSIKQIFLSLMEGYKHASFIFVPYSVV
uniref:Uncharacterized protein n=1 Tax=Solanum tuberosum TaxID=4113 RepID=M1A412_SOLTU